MDCADSRDAAARPGAGIGAGTARRSRSEVPPIAWRPGLKGLRVMAETRRRFDREFREGAVRIVRETGKPIAQVARDLGIHDGTLGNWVKQDRKARGETDAPARLSEDERVELGRLRRENAEL